MILKENPRNTASLKALNFASELSEMSPQTSPSKRVSAIFYMWFFFHNLLKFDIVHADVPFCKRAHNLETETEAKLNIARHPFP